MNWTEETLFIPNSSMRMIESWFISFDILMIMCATLVIILSISFLFIIVVDKTCHTISMMLIGNSCLTAFASGCSSLSLSIFTLENDLKRIEYEDSLCVFRGYIVTVSCSLLNSSFLVQALYRYIVVIYPTRLLWRSKKFQILIICLTWVFSFIYPIAFMFTGDIIYNVDNQICEIPFRFSFSIIYLTHCAYIIPVSMIIFIYLRLILYVKGMSNRIAPANILIRAQRELKMVRHTVILVTTLIGICFPYTLFLFMSLFTRPPKYHFRIAFIFVNISLLSIIIVLFQLTDPVKTSVIKRIKCRPNVVVARVALND